MAAGEIRIGALATLVGPFAALGEDGMRGVDLAIAEFGGKIGDRRLRVIKESSNAIPEDAYDKARSLVERDNIDFMVGPLSGNEGEAIRDFAKTRPERIFINGISASQDMTLRDPAPNFFSFSTNGVQWMAGLGSYVYNTLGYRRVLIIAEDYSLPHSQVRGFTLEFCRAGGLIVDKFWVALATVNYAALIEKMPTNLDALFVALGGTDAANFLKQYYAQGGRLPVIAGTLTADPGTLNSQPVLAEHMAGTISSGPVVDNNPDPNWLAFVEAYRQRFPERKFPSLACYSYYTNTKAGLLALRTVEGDLTHDQARFKAALASLDFTSPTGRVHLDHNRQGIAPIFVKILDRRDDGSLYNKLVATIPDVTSTLGIPEDEYLRLGPLGKDTAYCVDVPVASTVATDQE